MLASEFDQIISFHHLSIVGIFRIQQFQQDALGAESNIRQRWMWIIALYCILYCNFYSESVEWIY